MVKKNRPFVALCIHGVCICLMQYAVQTLGMYMYSAVYHDVTYQSIASALSSPFMIGSMILVPFMCKKLGLEKLIRYSLLIGGAICVVGQAVSNYYQSRGLDVDSAAGATSITMILLGALLTAVHLYDKLAKRAGAGTIVPITGFANAIVSPAIEFKSEGFVLGLAAKMFAVAGPVIVYGVTASVIYGVILVLLQSF